MQIGTQIWKIYLDTCCLSRFFDDQTQTRIHRETQAIDTILETFRSGRWEWIVSKVLETDAHKMTDLEIYELGIELLIDKLGPAGMMRFFWQSDLGKGDYSVDRHKLPQPDIDTIVKETQEAQETEQLGRKKWAVVSCQVNTQKMTDLEIYELGIAYLKDELGPVDFSQFLSQCEPLTGDYSVDRHKRPMPSIDMIVKRIKETRKIQQED